MNEQQPILIHAYSGPLGGSERILLDLLHRMDRPAVLACPPGLLADHAEGDGVTVVRVKERSLQARGARTAVAALTDLIGHGREIRTLARDLNPALIVAWGMRSAMASTLTLKSNGIPLVAQHVDLLPSGAQGRAARLALLRCDRVICLSYAIAEDLDSAWHASGRISVVHPGVELHENVDARRSDMPTALMLAAIEPWKGQHTALEAVANAPGVRLVLAGSPIGGGETEYLRELKARAALPDLAGRVDFPGWIDGPSALADATVLVHTAPSEPFGRALIDAMAAGRPVIAFDAAGPREIVTPDCGRLVPAESPAALAAAISEICANPTLAQAMGAAGRRRVAADFDAVHQATKWQRAALSLAPLPAGSKHVGPSAVEEQNTGGEEAGTGSETSIVTVIHNSAPELSRLLSSIARYLPAAEVIVVDSGSTDGGSSIAATWPGNATVLMLDGNEGYGAGCVTGMTAATRPITALINPDVELVDASLAGLTTELLSPNAPDRLLSPLLIHPDGQRQDAVHPLPGTAREFVRALIPAQALPGRLAALAEPHRSNRSVRVGWAVGACLLGRTETLRLLGPFDPAVHLYAEDLDLCLRAADRGIETWYHPEARVIHREAHSTRQAFDGEPSRLLAQRRRQVVGERLGRFAQQRDDAVQWITLCDRILFKEILRRDTAKERARLSGLREARRA